MTHPVMTNLEAEPQPPHLDKAGSKSPATRRRKPRIMLFTDSFSHGGTERQFVQVLRLIDREKYEVLAGCLKRRGQFLSEAEALGIPIYEFPITSLRKWSTISWLDKLTKLLEDEKVDLVHAFDFYTDIFAVTAAFLADVPVVIASRRELAGDRSRFEQWGIRFACQLASAVVANSHAAGSRLTGLFTENSRKVRVVPNVIDLGAFRMEHAPENVRRQLGFAPGTPLVGALAMLRVEKDLPTFLRAAALLRSSAPEVRFVIIGEGAERQRIESLARELQISASLLLLGDRHDVPDLLAALDVFVLSSVTESFPNAILEAMVMGRPVVATRVGGVPELVEDEKTGFLVPPGDASAMAKRIQQLLHDSALRRSMGDAGRLRAQRDFSPQRVQESLESLYDELLRKHHPLFRSADDNGMER
ncbi:MAG TPA: glycosyltransferase [Candidatus Acidoferrales bacterium]|nr:glycosyltransferase [Candidatus Acidoferrales bacterium]